MSKKSSTFAPAFEKEHPLVGIEPCAYGGLSSVGRASDCGSECRGLYEKDDINATKSVT